MPNTVREETDCRWKDQKPRMLFTAGDRWAKVKVTPLCMPVCASSNSAATGEYISRRGCQHVLCRLNAADIR